MFNASGYSKVNGIRNEDYPEKLQDIGWADSYINRQCRLEVHIMKDINQTAEGGDVLPEVAVGVITENAQLSLLRTRRELSPHNMQNCLFSFPTHFLLHHICDTSPLQHWRQVKVLGMVHFVKVRSRLKSLKNLSGLY